MMLAARRRSRGRITRHMPTTLEFIAVAAQQIERSTPYGGV